MWTVSNPSVHWQRWNHAHSRESCRLSQLSSSAAYKETELFCKWSQPGIMHLRDEGIAS